jgi:hypothetical protein
MGGKCYNKSQREGALDPLKHLVLAFAGYQMQNQKISSAIQKQAEAIRTLSIGYLLPLCLFQRYSCFRIRLTRFPQANFPHMMPLHSIGLPF